jgi:hypothetical protein
MGQQFIYFIEFIWKNLRIKQACPFAGFGAGAGGGIGLGGVLILVNGRGWRSAGAGGSAEDQCFKSSSQTISSIFWRIW